MVNDMWESPINQILGEMRVEMEGECLKAVQQCGFVVDKEELAKALMYDRQQYEKGYADGCEANKWIPCEVRLPEEDGKRYLVQQTNGIITDLRFAKDAYKVDKYDFAEYKGKKKALFYDYDSEYGFVEIECEAWMPLPTPYKKGECV